VSELRTDVASCNWVRLWQMGYPRILDLQ